VPEFNFGRSASTLDSGAIADDCMDAGGRAKQEARADDCMDAGGRAMQDDSMDGIGRVASGTKTEQLPRYEAHQFDYL
jgi:hypothetical protein